MFDPFENMKKIYLGKTVMIYSSSFSTMFFGKVIDINPAGIVVEPNNELSGRAATFIRESLPMGHQLLANATDQDEHYGYAEVHAVFLDWQKCSGFRIVGNTDESKHVLLIEDNILKKVKIENLADRYEC